jgi:phage gpG-like protein
MEMRFTLEGGSELMARLKAMQESTANLSPALLRAGVAGLKAAMERIDAGGPGWVPNIRGTPLLHDTGRLLSSLTVGGSDNELELTGNSITVGTNVSYSAYLQEGTGVYGASGERITGANGYLAYGGHVYRSIAGTPPRPYLFVDSQLAQTITDIFTAYVMGQES